MELNSTVVKVAVMLAQKAHSPELFIFPKYYNRINNQARSFVKQRDYFLQIIAFSCNEFLDRIAAA